MSTDYRAGYNDGEIDGSKHVIREVYAAIEHLNPPDTGMGVAELVTWALDRQGREESDLRESVRALLTPESMRDNYAASLYSLGRYDLSREIDAALVNAPAEDDETPETEEQQ